VCDPIKIRQRGNGLDAALGNQSGVSRGEIFITVPEGADRSVIAAALTHFRVKFFKEFISSHKVGRIVDHISSVCPCVNSVLSVTNL